MKLIPTGIPNLDIVLGGGVPVYSLNILAGQPGVGKTILSQQMLFNYARLHPNATVLYLVTLSEPAVKVVRYMQYFAFFDGEIFGERVRYQDIGPYVRDHSLPELINHIMRLLDEIRPELLVIDSFRAIRDLSNDPGAFRRFCYDLSVRLDNARCTTFLVGEYDRPSIAEGVEFAIADGIFYLEMQNQDGEHRRFLQVYKLRGRAPQMTPFPFKITTKGAQVLSPALVLRRQETELEHEERYIPTYITGLDELLRGGLPCGRSIMVSGVSGTGKTTFALQIIVEGARQGERGLIFSFEETADRLHRVARGFGWDLAELEAQGLVRIIFIPQTDIRVEENLEAMVEMATEFRPQRLVIDSFSVFLHRIHNPSVQREKTFQVATLIQQIGAVGLLISDVPASEPHRLSRFGVEETVVDGTIVLSSEAVGLQRRRYLEVFKMRSANHVTGRYRMEITAHGIDILYRPVRDIPSNEVSPPLVFEPVQKIMRGDLRHGLAWLVQGEAGVGKSTLAYQFAIDGLKRQEAVLFIAADLPPYQVRQSFQNFGFSPDPYLASGQLVILDAFSGGPASIDLRDPEAFLLTIARYVECMPRPLRKIFDSLAWQALGCNQDEFIALVHRKNRVLRQSGVTLFDTFPQRVLEQSRLTNLLNAFDVIVDLYTPDWGEMRAAGGGGYRVMQLRKAPTVGVDTRPYPYIISQDRGISVQHDFYRYQTGGD